MASYIGDAIQAYFGYPIADEDDSEFAVLAALEILEAVAAASAKLGHPLQVRLGIASGQVVVGKFVGAPSGVSTVAFGHVAHLAARLQVLAKPNTILVDPATFEAASGAIDFTRFGKQELKGFAEPVQVWQVHRARSLPTRFAKRTRATKLCGRNAELRLLLERWEMVARDRRGQAVLISGEAGIGKSRLLNEIQQRLRSFPQLTMQCSPTFENSTLYPFLTELQRIATVEDSNSAEEKLRKLRNALSIGEVSADVALAIFSGLLGMPATRPDTLDGISAERQRYIAEQVFIDLFGHLARATPILILFEDEQWADATSRDLLDRMVAGLASTPALLVRAADAGVEQDRCGCCVDRPAGRAPHQARSARPRGCRGVGRRHQPERAGRRRVAGARPQRRRAALHRGADQEHRRDRAAARRSAAETAVGCEQNPEFPAILAARPPRQARSLSE